MGHTWSRAQKIEHTSHEPDVENAGLPLERFDVLYLMDNRAWVAEHAVRLAPHDIEACFAYIREHHPFHGGAFEATTTRHASYPHSKELDVLATYADAVAVCCFEAIGARPIRATDLADIHLTGLGNAAFIALHHSNPLVRAAYARAVDIAWETWQVKHPPETASNVFGRKRVHHHSPADPGGGS